MSKQPAKPKGAQDKKTKEQEEALLLEQKRIEEEQEKQRQLDLERQRREEELAKLQRPKEEIVENVVETKKRMKEITNQLFKIKQDYIQTQKRKEELRMLKLQANKTQSKFSSFDAVVNRDPFVSTQPGVLFFNKEREIFFDTGDYMDNMYKDQLIVPQRIFNKSDPKIKFEITRPLTKIDSDFGKLQSEQMSEKEIQRLKYWQEITQKLQEEDLNQYKLSLEGSKKKEMLEQMHKHAKTFIPNTFKLNLFDEQPKLISEYPIPTEEVQKMISLPRVYEKKFWIPSNNLNSKHKKLK